MIVYNNVASPHNYCRCHRARRLGRPTSHRFRLGRYDNANAADETTKMLYLLRDEAADDATMPRAEN